jgi:DNA-binding transcriptional LysR family regulator
MASDQIGVILFDRSGRYPKLTSEGAVLLADAEIDTPVPRNN